MTLSRRAERRGSALPSLKWSRRSAGRLSIGNLEQRLVGGGESIGAGQLRRRRAKSNAKSNQFESKAKLDLHRKCTQTLAMAI